MGLECIDRTEFLLDPILQVQDHIGSEDIAVPDQRYSEAWRGYHPNPTPNDLQQRLFGHRCSRKMPMSLSNQPPRRESDRKDHWKPKNIRKYPYATAKRYLRHLARLVQLRRLKGILVVVATIVVVLLVISARKQQTSTTDTRHLGRLVRRLRTKTGSSELGDDSQALLKAQMSGEHSKERHITGIIGDVFLDKDEEDEWNAEDDDDDGEEAEIPVVAHDREGIKMDELGEDDAEHGSLTDKLYHGPYRELFSLTTDDRKFSKIHFGGPEGYNPSIIPHPSRHDLWIIVAQHREKIELITCTAGFLDGTLTCTDLPMSVPNEPSLDGQCFGELGHYNMLLGARDARIFYGPVNPYIMYISQSAFTCLGVWLQDLRMLIDAYIVERHILVDLFKSATEIRRPPPSKDIENSFFSFWDETGRQYIHHNIWPRRIFAQIDYDGSVGENLALQSAKHDAVCMARYMPELQSQHETLQQSTNSLMITTCKRKDPGCKPSNDNTYIATIIHHKSFYDFHTVFEPYIVLFNRTAPFNMVGISQRPFWIHGRSTLTKETFSKHYEGEGANNIPSSHPESFYITSMSWKGHDQRYHGHLDDPLLLAFGIEDTRSAAIDLLLSDLLQDIAYC